MSTALLEDNNRVLTDQLGPLYAYINDGLLDTDVSKFGPYTVDDASAAFTLVYSLNNYFDLSGYTREDLTTFIQGAIFQKVGNYTLSGMESDVFIDEMLILSTTPLSAADFSTSGTNPISPGGMASTQNLNNIVLGTLTEYSQDTGAGFGRMTQMESWGTGLSTAAPKLYWSRWLRFDKVKAGGGNATYYFGAPEVACVVPIVLGKEDELEYMMRLSRSLEPVY